MRVNYFKCYSENVKRKVDKLPDVTGDLCDGNIFRELNLFNLFALVFVDGDFWPQFVTKVCPIYRVSICADLGCTVKLGSQNYEKRDQKIKLTIDKELKRTLYIRAETYGKSYDSIPVNVDVDSC